MMRKSKIPIYNASDDIDCSWRYLMVRSTKEGHLMIGSIHRRSFQNSNPVLQLSLSLLPPAYLVRREGNVCGLFVSSQEGGREGRGVLRAGQGYPSLPFPPHWTGVPLPLPPLPLQRGQGFPSSSRQDRGTPPSPSPCYPPDRLRSGRYASCGHARGLSCEYLMTEWQRRSSVYYRRFTQIKLMWNYFNKHTASYWCHIKYF